MPKGMQSMRKIWTSAAVIIAALGLAACSSGPQLSTVNPAGLDFSGTWLIDFSESNTVADLGDPRRPGTRPGQRMTRKDAVRIATGSDLEYISNDFQVLRADKLDIELSKDSMGVRYHPGVYRDISWGERQRGLWEVNAGWEDNRLVIISEAGRRLRVVETMSRSGPNQLIVHVAIKIDDGEREVVRVFNRR